MLEQMPIKRVSVIDLDKVSFFEERGYQCSDPERYDHWLNVVCDGVELEYRDDEVIPVLSVLLGYLELERG